MGLGMQTLDKKNRNHVMILDALLWHTDVEGFVMNCSVNGKNFDLIREKGCNFDPTMYVCMYLCMYVCMYKCCICS